MSRAIIVHISKEKVTKRLNELKMTQKDLADAIGYNRQALNRNLSKERISRLGLKTICTVLNLSPEDLSDSAMALMRFEEEKKMRLIDANALIDFIDAGHLVNPNEPRWSDNEVANLVKMQPTAAEPEPISEEYANAVSTWLAMYQIKSLNLKGRYTPCEVIGWVLNDWRKENGIE